ncbi:ABC-2 type transport system permease protein [Thermocatellispora tengchongensis]|uniref:Transport permease protein n=1 Tax=Thermocatellispora tengchongensis TaxID=1073253 RepID=A0A840PDT8_9ACTN|nr:ABC transporter permease [Thermocatellispora tengchongensis]MBB5137778.1 ABC-2 type transport system permease protein [Thermocatellispora tengchongensis]
MGTLVYTELRLLTRSMEFLVLAVASPVVFFLVMSEVFGGLDTKGAVDMTTYIMISMAAFGAISGALAIGSRVALERQAGWHRQLRLTPLPGWSYVASKVAASMVIVLPALLLIFLAGLLVKGVDLTAEQWLRVLVASWVGALPFAVLGPLIGLSAKPDAVSALTVSAFLLMAMFGGLFMPVEVMPEVMATLAKALPSFWLAEHARNQVEGAPIDPLGPAVVAAWFAVTAALVVVLYRRDSQRV